MKLTGHLTESVYRCYAIVSESDLNETLAKLQVMINLPLVIAANAPSGCLQRSLRRVLPQKSLASFDTRAGSCRTRSEANLC